MYIKVDSFDKLIEDLIEKKLGPVPSHKNSGVHRRPCYPNKVPSPDEEEIHISRLTINYRLPHLINIKAQIACGKITYIIDDGLSECLDPTEQIIFLEKIAKNWKGLTKTEILHVAFWANGHPAKDISSFLRHKVGVRCVEAHIYNAGQKLDCHNRGDFIHTLIQNEMLYHFRTLYDLYSMALSS